jgi:hypothetical protein
VGTWKRIVFGHVEHEREGVGVGVIGLAAGAEYLGVSEAAFRKRRERSGTVPGEFRVGNQPAWKPADLDRWAGRRFEPSAP